MEQFQRNILRSGGFSPTSLPPIEKLTYIKGELLEGIAAESIIIGLLEGKVELCREESFEKTISAGQLVFFPPGAAFNAHILENSVLMAFHVEEQLSRYGFPVGRDDGWAYTDKEGAAPLTMNGRLHAYIESLVTYLDDGLAGTHFFEVKIRELLLLLGSYHTKREVERFFHPLSGSDAHFACFVFKNYQAVKTVRELAKKANLSLSSFDKEFRKAFKMPPYRWMKERRNRNIFGEIRHGIKPLKEISEEYGFSSNSQMNDYCKKEFGMTPGKIRESAWKEQEF